MVRLVSECRNTGKWTGANAVLCIEVEGKRARCSSEEIKSRRSAGRYGKSS
jgi:hypothetical protein